MALIKNNELVSDPYTRVAGDDALPESGALLLDLQRWQDNFQSLSRREDPVGIWLTSEQHPEIIADDLDQIDLVALEFPTFRDGRAYSYARLLRDRYGFEGELRAVGDVLLDQLLYMHRVGFDAFDIRSDDPLACYQQAMGEFGVFYQVAGDERVPALRLRHARG